MIFTALADGVPDVCPCSLLPFTGRQHGAGLFFGLRACAAMGERGLHVRTIGRNINNFIVQVRAA